VALASLGAAARSLAKTAAAADERLRQHLGVKVYARKGAGFRLAYTGAAKPGPPPSRGRLRH